MHITKILVMIYLIIGLLLVTFVNKRRPELLDDTSFTKSLFVMVTFNLFWLPLFVGSVMNGLFEKKGE